MKYVRILELDNNGIQQLVAMCRLTDGGVVVCEGDPIIVQKLNEHGIRDRASDHSSEVVTVLDGERFLSALPHEFASAYLAASGVMEVEGV